MRPPRATSDLLRLLQSISQPLYVLDDERRIVFANQACANWLGVEASELIGQVCRYQSAEPDPAAAAADVLCPPPEVFDGRETVAELIRRLPEGNSISRRARFLPLESESEGNMGVLAILEPADSPASEVANQAAPESQRLHQAAARFRAQMAASHALERLAGSSPAMARVRRQVEVAAASSGTVLICGPPGIGRQHVARAIHFSHKGPPGPLTPIACAALPAELIASNLQTALSRRAQLEGETQATILLIDIHLLPAELHREMTRWLEARRTGTRFIATVPEPLNVLAARNAYPTQLADLLSTIVIEIPPLAARREDIPLIAQMLLEDFNGLGGTQFRGFTSDALDRLAAHDWPGQIDELAAVVRQSAKTAEGYEIAAAQLPKQLRLAADAARVTKKHPEPIDLEKHLAAVESDTIRRALSDAKGNKARAARLLGLTRPRLYRRMLDLGLLDREESASDAP